MLKRLHDLNSTFSTLHTQASSIEIFFPKLVEGYRQAKENGLLEVPLQNRQLELLESLVKALSCEIKKLEGLMQTTSPE